MHLFTLARAIALASSLVATTGSPSVARPAPPCRTDDLPPVILQRWIDLGAAKTLGCHERTNGTVYFFHSGQIVRSTAVYGPNATFAAVVDAVPLIHLYWETPSSSPFDHWIVRFSAGGALVNQVTYEPGDTTYGADVERSAAANVVVHPGGRRGVMEIAIEGCIFTNGRSDCSGFTTLDVTL